MKLPSFTGLINNIFTTCKRFLFPIIAAVIGTIFTILLAHLPFNQTNSHHWYWNAVMSCYLAMLLLIALTVLAERKAFNNNLKFIMQLLGIALAIAYYFSLPDEFMMISSIRFVLFAIGFHLLIAFIPFITDGEMNGFWQYNKILFLRIITGAIYTVVLYIGLALALLAIEKLFAINVDRNLYFYLWLVLTGVFNTCFFLAGFPKTYTDLEENTDYPKGLKIFTQYVLLPIITIYLLILYAYMCKILFTQQWPVGWVSYLVLGFSVAGILSLLLIHPIRNDANNKWMLSFSRFFYFAIFPLLILLFFAIVRRINDYGITELRYFVLVLALWLFFIATYFLVSHKKNIKIIPLSLCVIVFLASFGPWGAFSVSLNSQKNHFVKLVEKNKILLNGKLIKAGDQFSLNDRNQISSITEYLVNNHGYQVLQPYFTQNLDSLLKHDTLNTDLFSSAKTSKLLDLMNIKFVSRWERGEEFANDVKYFNYSTKTDEANVMERLDGFDYLIDNYAAQNIQKIKTYKAYKFEKDSIIICFDPQKNELSLTAEKDSSNIFALGAMMKNLIEKEGMGGRQMKRSEMTVSDSNEHYVYKLMLKSISGTNIEKHIQINALQATILMGRRKK